MKYYIIFGPPGAGKGTQSELIIEKYKLRHLSTGELFRAEIRSGSKLGEELKKIIESGALVQDSLVLEMIENHITNPIEGSRGFIFDGFPRTIEQAKALDQLLAKSGGEVTALLSLEVADEVTVERLQKRASIEGRSDDASIETIQNRIDTYHSKTKPLIDYYSDQKKYWAVEGDSDIKSVFNAICDIMDKI